MRVLVLGGTRFIGYFLVHRLLAAGHAVTLLHRGATPDPFGDRVARIRGDRHAGDLQALLGGREFDAAVDLIAYTAADARGAVQALKNRVGRYVMISTGQVYLIRKGCPWPAAESDYDGPLIPEPEAAEDQADWAYGAGKRACEDVLAEAWQERRFPATRLRIPMVHGPRDNFRRIERYLARVLDGGPVLVPATPEGVTVRLRHVYVADIVDAILTVLRTPAAAGQAYNLCQQEILSLADFIALLGRIAGASPRVIPVPPAELAAADLDTVLLSPFSGRWMSFLDPARAAAELGFRHRPLERYLETIVTCHLAHPAADAPPGYDRRRDELALAARLVPAARLAGGSP